MSTGVSTSDEISSTYEDFKLQKNELKGVSYIIYKINDKKDCIVIDKVGEPGKGYEDFVADLPENDCRYAVVDVQFETKDGRETSKLAFISWVPDTAKVRAKMLYAGSKQYLRNVLVGIGIAIDCNDFADLDYESSIKPEIMKYA